MSKVNELITTCINELKKEYYYLFLIEEQLPQLVEKNLNKIDLSLKIALLKNQLALKEYIEKVIIKYLKSILRNSDKTFDLINNYINKTITESQDYLISLKELLKLSDFLSTINHTPNPDIIMRLLEENYILSNNIKVVVDKLLLSIKEGKLDKVIEDNILTIFIEVYCMMNNIEIEELDTPSDELSVNSYMEYIQETSSYKVLSQDEVRLLCQKIALGDEEAKEKLINHNLRLVISIALIYPIDKSLDLLDHIQNGNLGLMRAVEKYDYQKGFKFSTYASNWIRQSIWSGIMLSNRNIRLPINKSIELNKLKKARTELEKLTGCEATIDKLAKKLSMTEEQVASLLTIELDTCSLNIPLKEFKTQEMSGAIELQDIIGEKEITSLEAETKRILSSEIKKLFEEANLTEREKTVLILNYGLYDGAEYTLAEIAKMYNVSREMIRQNKVYAIKKIRKCASISSYSIYVDNPDAATEFLKIYRIICTRFLKQNKFYDQVELQEFIKNNPEAKFYLDKNRQQTNTTTYARKKAKAKSSIT